MTRTLSTQFARVVALALIASVVSAIPSRAVEIPPEPPDAVFDLPAGVACADFGLHVELWTPQNRVFREFRDQNGNVVRILNAGKGNTLAFTNVVTDETLVLRTGGSVNRRMLNADGSYTETDTGHNVVVFFPTDVPAGPSTILYLGRLVFTVDPTGVATIQDVRGRQIDICAELSP